jgi:ribonucleotide reductase alpha subunit
VTRKAIAGYKNYVTHGKDESDTTLYEIELIINENLKPVQIFNINNLNSNAESEFLENVTIFVRSVSTDSHMSDFPSKQTIRLKFWFIPDCSDHQ